MNSFCRNTFLEIVKRASKEDMIWMGKVIDNTITGLPIHKIDGGK